MALVLYNTYSKHEETFEPMEPGTVRMYTCGPTVYGRPHIGNYSSFLMADLLRRWLETGHGLQVTQVKNITDVGHLVADRDTGEDKIEKQAQEEFGSVTMESVIGIARKYEEQYLEDERALHLKEPAHRPRATDYIKEMIAMIEDLLRKGIAYVTGDAIYFDITSYKQYGRLSGNTVENLNAGARVDVNEAKHHPADFALWKFCVGVNESHVLRWTSPRGSAGESYPEGFPGWHIECSAMSRALLGDTIDIHTGGEDNIFPHHECEIAQSESVTGKQFVRLWLHKRRIDMEGEKMSKSLGNVLTIPDIVAKGFDALDIRYYLLSVHYRTNLKFSWKGLEDARKARRKILEWMGEDPRAFGSAGGDDESSVSPEDVARWSSRLANAMDQDLNTSSALGVVFECMTWSRNRQFRSVAAVRALETFVETVRNTFGCFDAPDEKIPEHILALIDERRRAREGKNFAEADRLRDLILEQGYVVRDTGEGQRVTRR